jgi:phage repressor protein C with HTH and peptisase S24 domain
MQKILFRVRIEGESMWPELVNGKRYFATPLVAPRVGNCVVFRDPQNSGVFVKKIVGHEAGGYRLASLVLWGSSSDDFGLVPREDIIGTVL